MSHMHCLSDWQIAWSIVGLFSLGWAGAIYAHRNDIFH